mmetsp:Transcript_27607/g.67923  ORF Transcript_27607/g.67923 Transcript_27607/m.67923 type:complete len:138 (-) Transcript_27607:281-694(-)
MAALMAPALGLTSSAFTGVKVTAKVTAKAAKTNCVVMANSSGPKSGTKSQGGQAGVGYKGSTQAGSAPKTRGGKNGYVYKLGLRNGKANVDEYSPIWDPNSFKTDGDKYEGDLRLAAVALVGVVGTGALAILFTSSL